MARNTPLGIVRGMVKAEMGKSPQSSSTAQDGEINQIINDVQQWLSSEYDWPFLSSRWDVAVPAGSRYLAFPYTDDVNLVTAINFERAGQLKLYVLWNAIWQEVNYGISEISEFNYINSDTGQVLDPIQRWKFDDEGMFEIWPMNASSTTLRFVGQRVLTALSNYTYTAAGADDTLTNGNYATAVNATGTYFVNTTNNNHFIHYIQANNCWIINESATVVTLASAFYVATTITGTWAVGTAGAELGLTTPPVVVIATANAWNDSATCDLDDLLITYFVSAEYATRQEWDNLAKRFTEMAQNRMQLVRATYPKRQMPATIIGSGSTFDRRALRIVPLVVVGPH